MPIRSIRHKALSRLFHSDDRRGLPPDQIQKLRRILAALDAATDVEEMKAYPGWKLHALKGDLDGFLSVSVSGNWRLIFRFENGDAFDADLIDYH
jgi:proteic killer suppression protein